jgi:hypothetical protein
MDSDHSYAERITKVTNGIQGHCSNVTSVPTAVTMCHNNDLSSHCCKNVFQQWPVTAVATKYSNSGIVPTVATVFFSPHYYIMCSNTYLFQLLQPCVPTMTLGHVGCIVPMKNMTADRHGEAHKVLSLS